MARSRRGGTSGLLSGKVGDVIYSVTRNPDGSLRQQISLNPEERDNPNTEEQARARLTMATIERAMFTFKDMMGSGFEGVDRGTNSVSKFSEVNYNYYKDKIIDGWVNDTPDAVRLDLPKKGDRIPRDGEFIISQGTLREFFGLSGSRGTGSNVYFDYDVVSLRNYNTLKLALGESDIKIGEQIACFHFGIGSQPAYSAIVWWLMYTDPSWPSTTRIDQTNWSRILKFKSNVPISPYYNSQDNKIHVRGEHLELYSIAKWGCLGWRRRAEINGVVRYSTQKMKSRYALPWREWDWNYVAEVKPSWLI